MKSSYLAILFSMLFMFISCAQVEVVNKDQQVVENAAFVSILMYDDSRDKNSYRVYFNNIDTNKTLMPNISTHFSIKQGHTKIQVVKKRETASIELVVKREKSYSFRIFENDRGHIEILQVSNSLKE